MRRWGLPWLLVAIALLAPSVGSAVSKQMCLFSRVDGVVLLDGKPVPGAEVERIYHWGWKDVTRSDSVRTDAEGHFSFPPVLESSLLGSILPHEPLVSQRILIRYDGREHKGWMYTKHNYRENGELGGRPIRLRCSLESEPSQHGEVFGICTFED